MRNVVSFASMIFAAVFFAATFASLVSFASAASVTKTFTFVLVGSLDNSTNRQTYTFNVTSTGMLNANVSWVGNATSVSLSISKSGVSAPVNETTSASASFDSTYNVSSQN